jgi:protein-arginine kinase activator protein McsA
MTLQRGLKLCERCEEPATLCAALTDSDSIVIAHRFLCETCAVAMFSVNVKQVSREEKLRTAVNRIKAQSSANERTAAFEDIGGENDG